MTNTFEKAANLVETSYARRWLEAATGGGEPATSLFPGSLTLGSRRRHDDWERENATLASYLATATGDLRERRQECYRRSRQTFNICITLALFSAASVYFIVIFSALHAAAETTIIPGLGTLVSASATVLAYRMYRMETSRADQIDRDLIRLESLRLSYLAGDGDPAELIKSVYLQPIDIPSSAESVPQNAEDAGD